MVYYLNTDDLDTWVLHLQRLSNTWYCTS